PPATFPFPTKLQCQKTDTSRRRQFINFPNFGANYIPPGLSNRQKMLPPFVKLASAMVQIGTASSAFGVYRAELSACQHPVRKKSKTLFFQNLAGFDQAL